MVQQRRRQERAERTRAHIIDTAAAAFAEHGFDGVSFNDVVKQSGLSKGAFYFHFSSKDDLAVATFRAKQEEMVSRLFAESLPADSARVNLSEADIFENHCVVAVSSFGSLIHTAVGSAGGSGTLRTKRSGWAA